MHTLTRLSIALACSMCFSWAAHAENDQDRPRQTAGELVIRDWLVIEPVGQYGRSAIHTDALEHQIVTGRWSPPRVGDTLTLPDGTVRTWERAAADEQGLLEHRALQGGYACATVDIESDQVLVLEARGHSLAYVNGWPRAGDAYQTGWTRLPVALRAGSNSFLLPCGRGAIQARLVPPPKPVFWGTHDPTVPDLIVGETTDTWAALPVLTAQEQSCRTTIVETQLEGAPPTQTEVPPLLPLAARKVPFRIRGPAPAAPGQTTLHVRLLATTGSDVRVVDPTDIPLSIRAATERHKRTFVSTIDGSVQYYAVTPAHPVAEAAAPRALFLTLHGAGVEATNQAAAYTHKDWGHVVAPTNRRPYGFDWEDWGRLDALEVLDIELGRLKTDPLRTYLLGHSMGGHGVWQIGAHFPDRFAAIATSAGWISFRSYPVTAAAEDGGPVEEILRRAASASDTLALSRNYLHHGVYVLHGADDDNVPVREARAMRAHLGSYHTDFAYYERPGAGHWWGNECVDWPPLFDFLRHHVRPAPREVRQVEFVTVNPGVSATSNWVTIAAQLKQLSLSSIRVALDPEQRRFSATTENVARLSVDLAAAAVAPAGQPVAIEVDGQLLPEVPWPSNPPTVWLYNASGRWTVGPQPAATDKGPHRYGPFKDALRHRFLLVYGTAGTPEENEACLAKARYDAETFAYRGNGSVDVLPDTTFDARQEPDRSVVVYGNATINSAWPALLGASPVQVERGRVIIGKRSLRAADLACLFVRPRPGSEHALVAAVAGTGVPGMRLTERIPYFLSGVALPDCIVLGVKTLTDGWLGVGAAGFFGIDWSLAGGEFAWGDEPRATSAREPGAD